jgi:hypothetical protein
LDLVLEARLQQHPLVAKNSFFSKFEWKNSFKLVAADQTGIFFFGRFLEKVQLTFT